MKTLIGNISNTIIHYVGNKTNGDGVRFSDNESETFDEIKNSIEGIISKSFKTDALFQFHFEPTLHLNPTYVFSSNIFHDKSKFIEETHNIARYLYEKSLHPKVKGGEVVFLYIENCEIDNTTIDAICILKYETKETILQFTPNNNGYDIIKQQGFSLGKLDKGCIIFNTSSENGYVCATIDAGAKKGDEAKFWINDFLHVRPINNSYHQTKSVIDAISNYLNSEMDKSFKTSKSDKAIIVNHTISELKKNTEVNVSDLSSVIFDQADIKSDFDRYLENYQVDNKIQLEGIEVEKSAIKLPSLKAMSTIKLDKNFELKINSGEKYIEKGWDNDLKMNFYKLYFKNEK